MDDVSRPAAKTANRRPAMCPFCKSQGPFTEKLWDWICQACGKNFQKAAIDE